MAFYCNDCQYIFDVKKFSCPFCGKRICNDETPETELLQEGYTRKMLAPKGQASAPHPLQAPEFHIQDQDILSSIRSSYETEHQGACTTDTPPVGAAGAAQRTAHTRTANAGTSTSQTEPGFFAQFSTGQPSQQQVVVPTAPQPNVAEIKAQEEGHNRELRALERERRSLERSYRRGEFFHALRSFNWRTLFRVLFVLAVIGAILFVWSMRYVILNSILDFVVSLVPIILVLAIFWNLIKSLFKGD